MRATITLTIAALAVSGGCEMPASSDPPRAVPAAMSDAGGRMMVRTEILFSLSKPDGSGVDELDWDKFVDDSIAVWFPSGFTVEDAKGRWRGVDGKAVSERSKIVILYHDGSDQTLKKIDELRRLFMQRFGNKSVIRASGEVWVTL
jgi:hypothetical protein